jgi:natural product biosynthesis luciferase-like monooxygenase protein
VELSLFYFADDSGRIAADRRYDLLLHGARFADQHGFAAVWTPERHFHSFGGLYPNPAVTAAALATITRRVSLRAGSVVVPLHDPLRVVEEWSVVDNLSGGRVGISFASGWHAVDFVLRPEAYRSRKSALRDGVDTVRRLWRGDSVERTDGAGATQRIRTYPRPVSPELPVWITSSGNVETFRLAGELGANVLTHLLGQSVEALRTKLAEYRSARQEAGTGERGHVTLMLHTFLGADYDEVRETVREPFSSYLRSSFDLLVQSAGWFGPDVDPSQLTAADVTAMVDHAFDRYFETSGLFGDQASARKMIEALQPVGVDEIACLIDFGVPHDRVLRGLDELAELRQWAAER